jgi:chitodextrinase
VTFDSSKPLKKVGNMPVPQYWNDDIEDWEVVKGSAGSYRTQSSIKLAKEPFNGSANLTKEFASEMNGFVISNDGNADLTFTIGGDTYTVKAGEVFEEEFASFTTVSITSSVAYRAYGKVTVGGIVVTQPVPDPDITAPDNVTNLASSNVTQNSLTLSWTASASSDCVGYDVYRGATLIGSVTGTVFNVTGLTQSTQYTFSVKAKDAANNIASGSSVTSTTSAQPADVTPPANVTGLASSNLTATGVTLAWTASASSDIKDYNIYNGATLITTVTGVTYNVTGLTASTSYTFTVKARDTANNEATGAQVSVTTSVAADTTAPTVTASPSAGTFTSSQSVTLNANETATIYYTTDGSTPTTSSTQYSSAIAVNATTTLKYFGRDTAGNSSTVQTATYMINLGVANLQLYLNSADLVGTTMPASGADLIQGVVWPDRSGKGRTVTITRQWNWTPTNWSGFTTSTGLILDEINGSALPNFSELNSGIFTWEFCFQMAVATNDDYNFFTTDAPWFRHKQGTTGALNYQPGSGNYYLDQSLTARLSDGSRHHVMLIADGTNVTVYVDNVQVHTHAATSASQSWTNVKVVFGKNGNVLNNKMTVVRYYDKALNSTERTTNFNECMA